MFLPNVIGGLFTTNYATAALTCSGFEPSEATIVEYANSSQGISANAACEQCGSGVRLLGYYDSTEGKHYQSSCGHTASTSPFYEKKELQLSIPGCDYKLTYYTCVRKQSSSDPYCDDSYYPNDSGTCVMCPTPSQSWTWEGSSIDVASGSCGFGTRNAGAISITDCAILNSEPSGDLCTYCDNTGCFNLMVDCSSRK